MRRQLAACSGSTGIHSLSWLNRDLQPASTQPGLAIGTRLIKLGTMGCFCIFFSLHLQAQSANKLINKGNKLYEREDYTDAEAEYKKALDKDKNSPVSFFNLGNSMYQQRRFEDAYQQYESSARLTKDKSSQSAANYNMGNTFLEDKKWEKGIPAYENALKLNPGDDEARYNLAYAQAMLKKQQQGGGNNDNKQDKNNKQNKNDKNNQNKNQQNQQQKDQNKNQQNKNNPQNNPDQQQEQQHPQPMPSKLTKQEANNLLNAVAQQEKQLQGKLDKNKKGVPVTGGKDW